MTFHRAFLLPVRIRKSDQNPVETSLYSRGGWGPKENGFKTPIFYELRGAGKTKAEVLFGILATLLLPFNVVHCSLQKIVDPLRDFWIVALFFQQII